MQFFFQYAENLQMKGIKFFIASVIATLLIGTLSAQTLHIDVQDLVLDTIFLENGDIQGYMLYVRQKPGMNSLLLTETTSSADGMATNYAYRAMEWNEINGDEPRMLNGKLLESEFARFSIIDSSPEEHPTLGQAFCLYIPATMQYGYPWTRNGITHVELGTFVNIRAFAALYADYSSGYEDNPFMFYLGKTATGATVPVLVTLSDTYSPQAVSAFDQLVKEVGGSLTYSMGPETINDDILKLLQQLDPSLPADIMFTMDSTGSMLDDVIQLRKDFIPHLKELLSTFTAPVRLGLLLYRDYVDNYDYEGLPIHLYPFSDTVEEFEANLFDFVIKGNEGGDPPEAVYEALQGAMEFYQWTAETQRRIILIGDAEPHFFPRGSRKYTKELVITTALDKHIIIDAIITPDGKTSADRK